MPNTKANFDTYPFKDDNVGGSPTSNQRPELKVTTLASSDFNDSNKFSFHQNRGTLKFVNIRETIKNTFSTSSFVIPDTHTTKFIVKNDTTLTINRPLTLRRKSDDKIFIPEELTALPFSMSFEGVTTTPETSSTYQTSYADITIGNLRTFSGDVHKVKLFTRQQDKQNSEFEKVGEFVLESKNTLVDESSPTANDPIGIFYSQSVIDNHWVSSSNTTTANNSLIMNAALISGSNRGVNDYVEFKTKDRFELEKGEEYILSFSGYYIKGDKVQSDGDVRKSTEIEVLLSGSVVSQTEDTISIGSIGDVGDSSSELFKGNVSGSIPYLYNYFYTHKKSGAKPKAGLVFRVHAGQFHLSNIKFEAVSEQNFNPGFYKTKVPMPTSTRRGQRYDFVSEFYDFNNNKADIEAATSASVLFAGPKQVLADGTDAVLSGSVLIGDSLEMYGVNPAYLRSVGYNGFDKTIAGTGDRNGGFLLWSGSIGTAIGASETYNGVGLEVVDASGSNKFNHSFLQFASNYKGTGSPRFRVQTSEFLLGRSGSGVDGDAYISGSNGNLEISSSNFLVSASGDVVMQGTITAAAGGTIGGFEIGDNDIFSGNSTLSNSNVKLVLGNTDGTPKLALGNNAGTADNITLTGGSDGVFMDGGGDFRVGDADGNRISFDQNTGLLIISSSNFFLGSKANGKSFISSSAGGELEISSSFFHLSSSGHITGSKVLFDGGKIGGFTITDTELKNGTDIILDSSNKKITLDNGSLVIDNNSGTPVIRSATNFASGDGFFLSSATSNNFRVGDAGAARIQFTGTNTEIYNSSNTKLVSLGATNEIAGWTINSSTISSNNLILNSAGIVETSTYVSGLRGFRLSAQDNGFLEVENAKIRGTLRTTVFEKETVNAVGGQLQVGNATVITGSAQISATATQIPVENVSGFTGSEVIMAKKVGNTGFSTEYMLITSQSRRDSTSNTDFSGSLFVVRGYSGSASQSQASGSLGDSPTPATTLEPGQVLVSTGFYNADTNEGSGYIRLNANPNDSATPFMDIVERTGSAIYDVDLKARLGDLAGISDTINGQAVSGFGLYTDNAFLKGGIVATYGSIGGFNISSTDLWAGNATLGNSGTKIVISADTTPKIALSNASADSMTLTGGGDGFFVDGGGDFRVGDADGERISFDRDGAGGKLVISSSTFMIGSKANGKSFISASDAYGLEISSSNFHLSASGKITASAVKLSGDITATTGNIGGFTIDDDEIKAGSTLILDSNTNSGEIKLGGATSITGGSNGVYMNGTGDFRVGNADGSRIAYDETADTITISSSIFDLTSTVSGRTLEINNTTPSILIESSSGGSVVGKVLLTANPGQGVGNQKNPSFVVSQSGMPIFSVGGEDHKFISKRDVIVNSLPIQETGSSDTQLAPGAFYQGANVPTTQNSFQNSADTNTSTAGGGAPTVKVANMLVASQFSASRMTANNTFFLSNTAESSSANTKYNIHIDDRFASGSGLESSPAVTVFDIRRNYKQFNRQDAIPQAMVFSSFVSTELDAGADSPRFVPNGGVSGSAIFHFQSILAEGSAGGPSFADGKKCIVRIDSDVRNSGATETDFVFIEGRAASGSYTHPTSIWQIQADGDFVTRGDITAFGVNSNFNTVSDRRFKKDVHTISGSMNKILQLRPTEFTWIEKNKQDVGFIAQEVEEIIPEVINTATGMIEEGKETQEVKTISYPKLVPYLVDTIQQLNKRIEELEKKVK